MPDIATPKAQGSWPTEFVLPICLVIGFATRIAALALLIMPVLIVLYPPNLYSNTLMTPAVLTRQRPSSAQLPVHAFGVEKMQPGGLP